MGDVTHGPGGISRKGDNGGVKGTGDVFDGDLHRGDVGGVGLR